MIGLVGSTIGLHGLTGCQTQPAGLKRAHHWETGYRKVFEPKRLHESVRAQRSQEDSPGLS